MSDRVCQCEEPAAVCERCAKAGEEHARAAGRAEAIETIARHFEKHYRDYVWCRVAVEGIRTLAPATTKPK